MPAPSIHGFAEKVALVNGAENPIGRATALQLALSGAYVIVGYSAESEEYDSALNELTNLGTLARAVKADTSTPEGARSLVAVVDNAFGRLDMLINCANFGPATPFREASASDFETALGRSAGSVFFVTQAAIRLMENRPKPKIVNIVSALDTSVAAEDVLLGASQNAVTGIAMALSRQLPPKFRSNVIAVSAKDCDTAVVDADLFRPKSGIAADVVARSVMFLLSSDGAGLNGQILKVE